jgi:hypothetical protein
MMSKQPGYQNSGYKLFEGGFATLMALPKGPLSEWPEEEREGLYQTFLTAFGKLEDELDDCAKNVSRGERDEVHMWGTELYGGRAAPQPHMRSS